MKQLLVQFGYLSSLMSLNLTTGYAQTKPFPFQARNAIYVEGGGVNELYSVNYDRLIAHSPKNNWFFGYRAGASLVGKHLVRSWIVGELYALSGAGKTHLELGVSTSVGRNWTYERTPYGGSPFWILAPVMAYRYQPLTGPSFFRLSWNPSLHLNDQSVGIVHSRLANIGIGFGRSF